MKSSQTGYLKGPVIGTFGVLFLSIALLWGRSKHKEGKLRKKKDERQGMGSSLKEVSLLEERRPVGSHRTITKAHKHYI